MAQKWNDSKMRTDADIRPGKGFEDYRNKPSKSGDYTPGSGGASRYPGDGGKPSGLRYGGVAPYENTIRDVRVGDVAGYGDGDLDSSMELAGKRVNVPKVPPMVKYDARPITGAGPLEEQRLTQQQLNAVAMGDPDYSPFRELDYENVKDANFSRPSQKGAQRPDKDFGR